MINWIASNTSIDTVHLKDRVAYSDLNISMLCLFQSYIMKRWHEDKKVMLRQYKILINMSCSLIENKPLGRFRKRHSSGCRKPRCRLCHSCKLDGIKSRQEIKHITSTKQQLEEV
jgi:hypothetical protein